MLCVMYSRPDSALLYSVQQAQLAPAATTHPVTIIGSFNSNGAKVFLDLAALQAVLRPNAQGPPSTCSPDSQP